MARRGIKLELAQLLGCMGYSKSGTDVWEKDYGKNGRIKVDFANAKIRYPTKMCVEDATTSNFEHRENLVVLECVDRLLLKGYTAESLTLEKHWPMGRKFKGKLDILVSDKNKRSYIMIECKTWGAECEAEKQNMVENGGQLFSYYQQDQNTKYLCLYASIVERDNLRYESNIVKIDDAFRQFRNVEEVHRRWNKQFSSTGIFENDIGPYNVQITPIKKNNLKKLEKEDGRRIYLQFLEILRHNVVSDKANAFNKIFNLFLCKICDEEKRSSSEQLEFQWIEGIDTHETLLGRLNKLYKEGMKDYLDKEITDYAPEDISDLEDDGKLKKILQELRLYKNQEFAFVEVFNKESFDENSKIVREVVELLQRWQLRYTHKQQFLGDFFELLINTGFKQESGQFFTPVPLVRFILHCIPFRGIICDKVMEKEREFLPRVIDFACGSGHFLTEGMDIVQKIIGEINPAKLTEAQRSKLQHYTMGDYDWAKDFMYGIERDYRLVKATKLACFLHGDGNAHVIHASGLDSFLSTDLSGLGGGGGQRQSDLRCVSCQSPVFGQGIPVYCG